MGCAMSLEAIKRYREPETEEMVLTATGNLEKALRELLHLDCVKEVRGRGLMMGVETDSGERVLEAVKGLLRSGVIALPDGPEGDVVAFTPPFSVSAEEINFAVEKLKRLLG